MNNNELEKDEELRLEKEHAQERAVLLKGISTNAVKPGTIQFRFEEDLMAGLQSFADAQFTSPGLLAREWVIQRLRQELKQNQSSAREFHLARLSTIKEQVSCDPKSSKFQAGPYFVMHGISLTKGVSISAESMERSVGLRPLRSCPIAPYTGRINHLGYETETAESVPARAYLQVYRTGEIETVRPLTMVDKVIKGSFADAEVIDAAYTICSALAGFQIPLPYLLQITVCGLSGLMLSGRFRVTFSTPELTLPEVEISAFSQISATDGSLQAIANTMHDAINVFWNAGGYPKSLSFDGDNWVWAKQKAF